MKAFDWFKVRLQRCRYMICWWWPTCLWRSKQLECRKVNEVVVTICVWMRSVAITVLSLIVRWKARRISILIHSSIRHRRHTSLRWICLLVSRASAISPIKDHNSCIELSVGLSFFTLLLFGSWWECWRSTKRFRKKWAFYVLQLDIPACIILFALEIFT